MSWSEAKENFQNKLNVIRANLLNAKTEQRRAQRKSTQNKLFNSNTDPVIQQYNLLLKKIEQSEQFLSNLGEMKDFCPALTEEFLAEFLNSAILVIENPKNVNFYVKFTENLKSFSSYAETDLEENKGITQVKSKFYLDSTILMSVFMPLLIVMVATGATMGAAAAAVPAVLIVAAIASIVVCLLNINKNNRFIEDEQKKEIKEFVESCNPAQAIEVQLPETPQNIGLPQFAS